MADISSTCRAALVGRGERLRSIARRQVEEAAAGRRFQRYLIYAPPHSGGKGHLLFLRERTVMAQPFDAGRLELAGDPFPVAEQVGTTVLRGHFSVSDNGVLAYWTGAAAGNRSLAWFDRTGKQAGTVGSPGRYNEVSLSPDQTRVATSWFDVQGGSSDIWLLDLARGTSSRFTFDPAVDILPAWAPDGSRIAFSSNRDGAHNLYQKVSSGAGNDEPLLKSDAPKNLSDWSRDGRYLVYTVNDPKTKRDLWVLPLEGDRKPQPYLVTPFDESHGQLSPDSRWMAYVSNESGTTQVYVQPFPVSGGKWQISTTGGSRPRWRRDGKELYYLALDGKLMAVPIQPGRPCSRACRWRCFRRGSRATSRRTTCSDGRRRPTASVS